MVDDAASGDGATARRRANALALAVLAQLAERPMHPYEIARTLKDRRKDESVRLNYGSLYSVITALVRDGFIEPAGTEQDGNRPQRTVYRLTGAGRTEVDDWMRALLGAPVKEYPQFMAALSFLPLLGPDDVADLLRTRLVALRVKVRRIEDDLEDLDDDDAADGARGETSELAVAGSRYELAILRAELAYTDVLARRIVDGTLGGIEAWRSAVR